MARHMKKIRVFIVDDHPIFRCGLREVINSDAEMTVIGEAADASSALTAIRATKPSVVILDINLPDESGLKVCQSVTQFDPPASVIMLTLQNQESSFNAAMDAGACGYLLKENAVQEVITAIRAVASGNIYFTPSMARYFITRRQRISALHQEKKGLGALSPTERLVLRLVSENKTNKEIGEALRISHRTVETHRTHICEKLELQGPRALLHFAMENKSQL
jgi:DNA-binding NarL/FixJ family response regulator